MLDHEIATRRKACSSFGRLYDRFWKDHRMTISTKVKVYEAVVLTILLYDSETWILYTIESTRRCWNPSTWDICVSFAASDGRIRSPTLKFSIVPTHPAGKHCSSRHNLDGRVTAGLLQWGSLLNRLDHYRRTARQCPWAVTFLALLSGRTTNRQPAWSRYPLLCWWWTNLRLRQGRSSRWDD